MRSYGVLHIELDQSGQRLDLAVELLKTGTATVVLENRVALVRSNDQISCCVITRFAPHTWKSAPFETEIEEAREMLNSSSLYPHLLHEKLEWMVIHDYGVGEVKLWPSD